MTGSRQDGGPKGDIKSLRILLLGLFFTRTSRVFDLQYCAGALFKYEHDQVLIASVGKVFISVTPLFDTPIRYSTPSTSTSTSFSRPPNGRNSTIRMRRLVC